MAEQKAKGGKKQRKYDRNRKSGQNLRYVSENRAGKSKARALAKHLKRFPADGVAVAAYQASGYADKALLLVCSKARTEYEHKWQTGQRHMPARPMLREAA